MRIKTKSLLRILFIGLPLHTFAMMLLFGTLHVNASVISVVSTWKEALLALPLVGVIIYWTMRRDRVFLVSLVDVAMGRFAIWIFGAILLAFIVPNDLPVSAKLYGIRLYFVPLAMYILGRFFPLQHRDIDWFFSGLIWLGILTSGLAVIEFLLPNEVFFTLLRSVGYQAYFADYVTGTPLALYGPGETSASMWLALDGDRLIRRAGSVYFVSKPFAFTYLLILPTVFVAYWFRRRTELKLPSRRILAIGCVLVVAGLGLSLTRAAIAAGMLAILGIALELRKTRVVVRLLVLTILGGMALLFVPAVQNYLQRILSTEDSSTRQHLDGWINALSSSGPRWIWGYGIGTANQELGRLDVSSVTALAGSISESIYVQTFQELGMVGLILYVSVYIALYRRSLQLSKNQDARTKYVGICLRWSVIMSAIVALTAMLTQGVFVYTYFFWFLCGLANSERFQITLARHHSYLPGESGSLVGHGPAWVVDRRSG